RVHQHRGRAALAAVRRDAGARVQPWHPPSRPDHRGDHPHGPFLPRDRPAVAAAGRGAQMNAAAATTLELLRPSAHVAEVWLNRPDVRNAFNDGVIRELTETFRALSAD